MSDIILVVPIPRIPAFPRGRYIGNEIPHQHSAAYFYDSSKARRSRFITMDQLSEKTASDKTSNNEPSASLEEARLEKAETPIDHGSLDDFTVFWDEPIDQDPENPMNWSTKRKATIIGTISFLTFLTPLASSMFAPGVPDVIADFNTTSRIISTFVVSIYVLGFAFGKKNLKVLTQRGMY